MNSIVIVGEITCRCRRMMADLLANDFDLSFSRRVAIFSKEELAEERIQGFLQAFLDGPTDVVLSLKTSDIQLEHLE